MQNLPVIADESTETINDKRKRLAIELRAIQAQHNSKLLELLETGVDVIINIGEEVLVGQDGLFGHTDVSYQTKPKHY